MDPSLKAVFLSYASQDAEAAARICEALRAAGVEVWFDRNELRGGDSWDAKIRRQIRECALFVPVISANTQARQEGYFRLEWKLAVDRSHLMAEDAPFLVPVAIDDVPEAVARVPDKFREVQWTRLRLEETPLQFAQRAKSLLAGGANPDSRAPHHHGTRSGDSVPPASFSQSRPFRVALAVMMGAAGASLVIWQPWKRTLPPVASPAPAIAAPASPQSESRKLVERARALYEPWDGSTREDFALADELIKRAIELDSTDAEAWAASAILSCGKALFGHDRSTARREMARSAAERAIKLAPDSNQARFARAFYFRFNDATKAEAERMLRELVEREPTDKLMLRTLGSTLRNRNEIEEALQFYDRAAALPGGDPVALYNKYLTFRRAGRFDEAEAAIDQALAQQPTGYNYRAKVNCLVEWHGDLDAAAAMVVKIPAAYLMEDGGAFCASRVWLWRRETQKCLEALAAVPRDILDHDFTGPKGFLAGQAHQVAGNKQAAQAEWRAALQVVERQLAAEANAGQWLYWKAHLLALTGQPEEAEKSLKTFEQITRAKGINNATAPIYLLLGKGREALLTAMEQQHAESRKTGNVRWLAPLENALRFDPMWDPLRSDERFARLVASFTTPVKFTPAEAGK
ncbi:MAG TPA: TIR domain-containing protein [Opitutaceae bacterium]|nr:TIR domain-containing protein [Opitutaceae bacterium]